MTVPAAAASRAIVMADPQTADACKQVNESKGNAVRNWLRTPCGVVEQRGLTPFGCFFEGLNDELFLAHLASTAFRLNPCPHSRRDITNQNLISHVTSPIAG